MISLVEIGLLTDTGTFAVECDERNGELRARNILIAFSLDISDPPAPAGGGAGPPPLSPRRRGRRDEGGNAYAGGLIARRRVSLIVARLDSALAHRGTVCRIV